MALLLWWHRQKLLVLDGVRLISFVWIACLVLLCQAGSRWLVEHLSTQIQLYLQLLLSSPNTLVREMGKRMNYNLCLRKVEALGWQDQKEPSSQVQEFPMMFVGVLMLGILSLPFSLIEQKIYLHVAVLCPTSQLKTRTMLYHHFPLHQGHKSPWHSLWRICWGMGEVSHHYPASPTVSYDPQKCICISSWGPHHTNLLFSSDGMYVHRTLSLPPSLSHESTLYDHDGSKRNDDDY